MKRVFSAIAFAGSILVFAWTLFGIALVVWIAIMDSFKPAEYDGRFFQFGEEP
jgi:low affinity Fe/Cu permease